MTIRCKVRCFSVTEQDTYNKEKPRSWTTKFSFVYGDNSPENRAFWEATPSGTFEVQTAKINPWEVGKEYYIDVIPA